MRYLIQRRESGSFGLYDLRQGLTTAVAVFAPDDAVLAHDIAEMLNNREGFWASQRVKPSARHHAGTSPPRFGA